LVSAGWVTERDGRLFNSYAVCLPDGAVHIHHKLHASAYEGISDGGSYTVFDTPWGVRVGVLICLDNNIVENVRATALLRCLPARAHDNGMFIVFSNGVGRDDDEVRTGNAMLVDPCGRIIAETSAITDDMVAADLDQDQASASVGQWWTRFRRPELYRPLVR
jgi:predicted amidohydrolase